MRQARAAPGLESSPYHELVKTQLNSLGTGILSFELADNVNGLFSFEADKKLLNALRLSHIAVSLGDPASLIQHPASMTHHNVSPEVRAEMGITDGLIRFLAGLEDAETSSPTSSKPSPRCKVVRAQLRKTQAAGDASLRGRPCG